MKNLVNKELKQFNLLVSEINSVYHEAALKNKLSDSSMIILYTICNFGEECLLSHIVQASGTSKQTINSALRKLEAEDILYLKKAGGRNKKVCLTEKGKEFVKKAIIPVLHIENEIFDTWSPEEKEFYLELTKRYLTTFKEKVKEL